MTITFFGNIYRDQIITLKVIIAFKGGADSLDELGLQVLKELRIKAGLTQKNVSKALGYQTSLGYHYIEKGRCNLRLDQAITLSKLYHVSVEKIFTP